MKHIKCILTVVGVAAFVAAGDFVIHALLLGSHYEALATLWRPKEEMTKIQPLMFVANLIIAFGLVWIYDQGKKDKPFWVQGLRFGFAVSLIGVIPNSLIYYVLLPYPCVLLVKQICFMVIQSMLTGVLVARLRHNETPCCV